MPEPRPFTAEEYSGPRLERDHERVALEKKERGPSAAFMQKSNIPDEGFFPRTLENGIVVHEKNHPFYSVCCGNNKDEKEASL